MKNVVELSCFVAGMLVIGFTSCKKNDVKEVATDYVTPSDAPAKHEGTFPYRSYQRVEMPIHFEDKDGNVIQTPKGSQHTLGYGCDIDADEAHMFYTGYSLSNFCFQGPTTMTLYYELDAPSDFNMLLSSTQSYCKVKFGPQGFHSSPTGTGYRTLAISSIVLAGSFQSFVEPNVTMNRYILTSAPTTIDPNDYCGNFILSTLAKVETDCQFKRYVGSDNGITVDLVHSPYKGIYDFIAYNGTEGNIRRFLLVANYSLCNGFPCQNYQPTWSNTYRIQWRKQGTTAWKPDVTTTNPTNWYTSVGQSSFYVNVSTGAGIYEYRFQGLLSGDQNTGLWSDWSEIETVVVN